MSEVSRPRAVLFDLDGTLVDSAPDIATSIEFALAGIGAEVPARTDITRYIGNGATRLIHRALTKDANGVADDAQYQAASELFFSHYAENICVASTTYPGVRATLEALRDDDVVLACVTNKPAQFTGPLLEALDLHPFFAVCVSGDSLSRKKPAPDQLHYVATQTGIPVAACCMIGDSAADILAAHNARMPVIAVSYGYGDAQEIADSEPTALVDRFADILPHLRGAHVLEQNVP